MNCLLQCYWMVEFFLGIAFWIALYFLSKKAIRSAEIKFQRKTKIEKEKWDKIFFPALNVIFLSIGIYYVLARVGLCFEQIQVIQSLQTIRNCLIVLSFAWMAYRAKQVLIQKISPEARQALSKIFSIAIVLVTILLLLSIFHVDVIPLLAFGGIGAAALGFAAKDVMSSFFGGMMLAMTRSFTVGDQILIPEKNLEGVIEEMGWNVTMVRSKDRSPVYLPNTLFSQMLVINLTRRTGRRILETLYLRHEDFDKLFSIMEDVRSFLLDYKEIDHTVPVLVFMSAAGKYSLEFSVDVYTTATSLPDYVRIREEILKQIAQTIIKRGAQMAKPIHLFEVSNPNQLSS